MTTQEIIKLSKYENEILGIIENQLSEYNSVDGIDASMTQSDLQGAIQAIVLKIYKEGAGL